MKFMVQGKLENKKIGILGGSFDPAHVGHIRISKLAKKNYNLSQVIWAITKQNPFKKNNPNDLYKRTAYAKKINKNNKFIKVKCFEEIIKSNRTVDLIKYLKKKFKHSEIFFLMGADNLINFHKWKGWRRGRDRGRRRPRHDQRRTLELPSSDIAGRGFPDDQCRRHA